MGVTQELEQKVLHKYGWSIRYDQDANGSWMAYVTVGVNDTRQFVSDCTASPDTKEGTKLGKEAAAHVTLDGLSQEIQLQQAKPEKELAEVYTQQLAVYNSNEMNWDYFWNHKPTSVGIDVEGNKIIPPVLVQIATNEYVILEAPRSRISKNLERLLADDTITKVFCDNNSHHDKKSLGILEGTGPNPNKTDATRDFTTGPIVDIEAMASQILGPVSVARGLPRIISLLNPDLGVWIRKPKRARGQLTGRFANVGRFAMIEQGKARPLRGINDLSHEEQQYAALDAWCTLQAFHRLQEVYRAENKMS